MSPFGKPDLDTHPLNQLKQSQTPLVSALKTCADRANAAFHTPGHKQGQGISPEERSLFGQQVFRADLPELPELDNLFAPEGVILQAQKLAAEAFGAEQTWFLANGSTCGIEAAILATCGPGDKLILPRNVHRSAISGLVISGAVPVYVQPSYSTHWDLSTDVKPADIEAALAAYPEAKAVLVVSPTYHGICSELAAIARLTHRYNIPLIVDEAHGPHFIFHPELPLSALAAGADLAVQSAHKVLSAFTQSALLHVQGNRLNRRRLHQALQLTQSTSPSYLLLGSLDAARQQMATAGLALMTQTILLANQAHQALSRLPGLRVLQPRWEADKIQNESVLVGDRTRLTVDVSQLGITGFQADELLHEQFGVTAELPALRHLMFIVSLGNTAEDINQLIAGFRQICDRYQAKNQAISLNESLIPAHLATKPWPSTVLSPHSSLSPRQVFFASSEAIAIRQSIGQICAETICPYPPGIPLLLPGETITASVLDHLQTILAAGGFITGCHDPSLKTIQIVKT